MITTKRITKSLDWMVKQFKWQFDNERQALGDEGSGGGYSPLLTEASNLFEEIKKMGDCLFVDLDSIPGFKEGRLTKKDISTMIKNTLKIK